MSNWEHYFRSWPNVTPGWRIGTSGYQPPKEQTGTDTLNAFLFGHGLMMPTLADVVMLTGLNISASHSTSGLLGKLLHRLEMKGVSGWKGYIAHHSKTGQISNREHTTFLTMWLEKFIFCGKIVGPTSNMQFIAESLATGNLIPLGKHLLGSVYFLLHQVSVKLSANQPIGNLGRPLWFINLWLNLYLHKVLGKDLDAMSFPGDHTEEEPTKTRRCMSLGEAASAFTCNKFVPSEAAHFFRCFYNGFTSDKIVWYPYLGSRNKYELPTKFHFESIDGDADSMTILGKSTTPGILPVDFYVGRNHQPTYELYYPSVAARQLGFGQLPIHLFFAHLVLPRQVVTNGIECDRLTNLAPDAGTVDLENWVVASFTSKPFRSRWSEWCSHIFFVPAKTYC